MLNPIELIIKKREGNLLNRDEYRFMVESYIRGDIPDYQMSAFLMSIFFRGMETDEIQNITEVYVESGKRIEFPKEMNTVDKHSTGGVGDKISLMLAPIVAECGGMVPMISGRGLGHTGGTLDKLEAIPGFSTDFSEADFKKIINEVGFSIISQSKELVPADKKIYALRDVTGTVESLELITASIISKKIAEGAQNLVMDLKIGTGAFMKTYEQGKRLGEMLKRTAEKLGQSVEVVFSNMNSPLGFYIGNGLEIKETIEYLSGKKIPDIDELTRLLAVRMIMMAKKAGSVEEAENAVEKAISSGKALERFARFIKAQGGDEKVCEDLSRLPQSKFVLPIISHKSGWVTSLACQDIGYALVNVRAGRRTITSQLDYSSGAYLPVKVGDFINQNDEIGQLYCNDKEAGEDTVKKILAAIELSDTKTEKEQIILGTL